MDKILHQLVFIGNYATVQVRIHWDKVINHPQYINCINQVNYLKGHHLACGFPVLDLFMARYRRKKAMM